MDVSFEPFSFDEVPEPQEGWTDLISIAGAEGASSAASSVTRSLTLSATGPSDVAPSTEAMGRALFDAHSSVAGLSQPRLPWESGVFGWIFGDGPSVVPMPFNVAELPSLAAQLPVLKARTDENAEDEKQRLWVTALNKWLLVLRLVDFSGTVGSAVQSAGSEEARHSIIRDVLGTRSPRTAIKRANSILRWLKWAFQSRVRDLASYSREPMVGPGVHG